MKVQNKTIIVTGAGSGMGRAITLNLLSKNTRVIAADINKSALHQTSEMAADKIKLLTTYVLDITNKDSVEQFADKTVALHDNIDGLINNAGIIQPFTKVTELGYETVEQVMNVNFFGTLYMIKAFLPHLLTRPEAHIVNISSMGGFLPVPGQTIYGASKAAVKLLTEGLQSELSHSNVKVSIVFPGAVNTNIKKNSGLETSFAANEKSKSVKILSPLKAAQIIIDGIEKNESRVLVGNDAKFMDVFYRLNPGRAAKFVNTKMQSVELN